MPMPQTRRHLLSTLSLAGAASLLGVSRALARPQALETTTVRFLKPALCASTLYAAEELLLRAEGFTEIGYVDRWDFGAAAPVMRGEVDFGPLYASQGVRAIDAGERITLLPA